LAANEAYQTKRSVAEAERVRSLESKAGSGTERPKVTAVLVHWKRKKNIISIASALSSLPFVNDIVIFVNNLDDPITRDWPDVWPTSPRLHSMLRIVKSRDGNLNTEGRFRACSEHAKNEVCMFIDDDFWPDVFRSLYNSWLDDRDSVHALANHPVYWNDLRWSFSGRAENGVDINTGFTWLGVGAIVRKTLVDHFLNHQLSLVPKENRGLADNYFTIMSNRVPRIIIVPLYTHGLDQSNGYSATQTIIRSLDAARKEAIDLVVTGQVPFLPLDSFPPPVMTHVMRVASSTTSFDPRVQGWYSMKRTFLTNIMLREIRSSPLSHSEDRNIWDYYHTPESAKSSNYFSEQQMREFGIFSQFPPSFAVDDKDTTFWQSTRDVVRGDWFGLDTGSVGLSMNSLVISSTTCCCYHFF
jgi:hypothetical protein